MALAPALISDGRLGVLIVTLTLDIISAPSGMPAQRQRSFREDGGRIGRDKSSDWVLPHNKVSSRHAVISYRNGVFYIEDRSRNGVFLNSTTNRLTPGKPQALQAGDVLFIEPYEIQVSVSEDVGGGALGFDQDADPFGQAPVPQIPVFEPPLSRPEQVEGEDFASGEVDPLKLLSGSGSSGRAARSPASRDVVQLEEIERRPLQGHYQPPAVIPPAPPPAARVEERGPELIPAGYDPLRDSGVVEMPGEADPFAPARPDPFGPAARDPFEPAIRDPFASSGAEGFPSSPADPFASPPEVPFEPPPVVPPEMPKVARPAPRSTPVPAPVPSPKPAEPVRVKEPPPAPPPPPEPPPAAVPSEHRAEPMAAPPAPRAPGPAVDLAAVLEGAGLSNVMVTPELAENFGRILTVVVAGVMDLLRARQQVKDELRMRQTQFRPADNNPLKFSANVEDALHNLLVKRNPAYLKPVDAFADAFDDLRDHQLAMLAGLRVAFEAMLAEFDPAKLEEQFDRQLKKGSLLSVPAKLRYWEAYREKTRQILADMDATFRKWFGEEFVKAYEEQLERLEFERSERNR
jgi:type VI secretion system FHA domain protein